MSLERRLARLERVSAVADDVAVRREVLRRLTDEELDALETVLEGGESLPEAEAPILLRVREIEEEVHGETP